MSPGDRSVDQREPGVPPTMVPVLTGVTEEVFDTMVFTPVKALPPQDHLPVATGAGIVAAVSFSGSANGIVLFHAALAAGRQIAAAMLGLPSPEDCGPEVADAIGELTNMIAGAFRTRMADHNGAWTISTPQVTVGSDLSVRHARVIARAVFPFEFGTGQVFVELVLTQPEPVAANV
jgi:chemotaxis protein CheX